MDIKENGSGNAGYGRDDAMSGAVEVTSADFNGISWDGSPFRGNNETLWLERALNSGHLCPFLCDRDYAVWNVKTPNGVVRALPGDRIVNFGVDGPYEVIERHEKYRDSARLPASTQGPTQ